MTAVASIGGLIGYGSNLVGNTHTTITFAGLWHFLIPTMGSTVSVQMNGQDCGDFTVAADGTVTVPLLGTTFNGVVGIVSLANLIASNGNYDALEQTTPVEVESGGVIYYINVPIVIGRGYVTQGQRLRTLSSNNSRTPEGPSVGETRRSHMYSMLVKDGVVVKVGTSLAPSPNGDMQTVTFNGPDGYAGLPVATGFDGVWWETLDAQYDFDNQFCWQIDRPWPFVLCATSTFTDTEER